MTRQARAHGVAWVLALAGCLCGPFAAARAGEVQARVQTQGDLRVCISPGRPRITFRNPRTDQLSGLDIDLAAALASDLHARLQFVDSSLATLAQDLHGNRCDVAMFGIAMLPQRMEHLQFASPYLQSDIHAVTTRASRVVRQWSDIDRPGVLVGVEAGTLTEQVMRQRLRHANLVPIQPPQTRERELMAGRVDVFMTDYPSGRALADDTEWAALLTSPTPFHVLHHAHASKPGDAEWRATLNAFVARIQQDGRLDAAARRHGLDSIVLR